MLQERKYYVIEIMTNWAKLRYNKVVGVILGNE